MGFIQKALRASTRALHLRRSLMPAVIGALLLGAPMFLAGGVDTAWGNDGVLRGAKAPSGGTLADMGVAQLERLPWNADVVRFHLGRDRPVAIAACYLMERDLIVISATGRIYVISRTTMQPRWVASLRHRLARPPAEGPGHYVFLTKDLRGACWVETFNRRNGALGNRFPRKLSFSAASGISAGSSVAYVPSLGRPGNNKTLETVNLVSGRTTWGYHGTGMIMGGCEVQGDLVIFGSDDGVVTALPTGATAPAEEAWRVPLSGGMDAGLAVSPEQVVAGTHDGLLYGLDTRSGDQLWMITLGQPLYKRAPWILGRMKSVKRPSDVDGAADVDVDEYQGIAFARTRSGLHAVDVRTGQKLFHDKAASRPVVMHGKWVLTADKNRRVCFRDTTDGYQIKARLNLHMFDLIPTNRSSGAIFGCTHDGTIVAAIPK